MDSAIPPESRHSESSDVVRHGGEADQEQKGKGEKGERHEHEKRDADNGDDHHHDRRNQDRKEQQLNQQSDGARFQPGGCWRLKGSVSHNPAEQQNDRRQDAEHGQPRHREDEREGRAEASPRAHENIIRAASSA